MKRDAIALKDVDNVATALKDLKPDDEAVVGIGDHTITVTMKDALVFGHKFAVRDIPAGEDILKYGEVIGRATQPIPAGGHAHVQNIESLRGRGDLA